MDSIIKVQHDIYGKGLGPPILPHGDDPHAVRERRQKRKRQEKALMSVETLAVPPATQLSQAARIFPASLLPSGFPKELAFRALAAYSTLRTLSLTLRLSPFTPNVFLRALFLPFPNRLLGQVHVSLLRILLASLQMGYSNARQGQKPPTPPLTVTKKRKVDGLRWPLRAGDNLEFLDHFTWPLFFDDYAHLTADVLYSNLTTNLRGDETLAFDMKNLDISMVPPDLLEEEKPTPAAKLLTRIGATRRGTSNKNSARPKSAAAPTTIYLDDTETESERDEDEFRLDDDTVEEDDFDDDSFEEEQRPTKRRKVAPKAVSNFTVQSSQKPAARIAPPRAATRRSPPRSSRSASAVPKTMPQQAPSFRQQHAAPSYPHQFIPGYPAQYAVTNAFPGQINAALAYQQVFPHSMHNTVSFVPGLAGPQHLMNMHTTKSSRMEQKNPSMGWQMSPQNIYSARLNQTSMEINAAGSRDSVSRNHGPSISNGNTNVGAKMREGPNSPPKSNSKVDSKKTNDEMVSSLVVEESQPDLQPLFRKPKMKAEEKTGGISTKDQPAVLQRSCEEGNRIDSTNVVFDREATSSGGATEVQVKEDSFRRPTLSLVEDKVKTPDETVMRVEQATQVVPACDADTQCTKLTKTIVKKELFQSVAARSNIKSEPIASPRNVNGNGKAMGAETNVKQKSGTQVATQSQDANHVNGPFPETTSNDKVWVSCTIAEPKAGKDSQVVQSNYLQIVQQRMQAAPEESFLVSASESGGNSPEETKNSQGNSHSCLQSTLNDAVQCTPNVESSGVEDSAMEIDKQMRTSPKIENGADNVDSNTGEKMEEDSEGSESEGEELEVNEDFSPFFHHFQAIELMREGIPYHELPVNRKLDMLEYLIDEFLSLQDLRDEIEGRNLLNGEFNAPYGKLPFADELANLENEDNCAVCGKEGDLLCCDGCVSSYHRKCISMDEHRVLPDGNWYCPECQLVDPAKYGPLRGGRKSKLDWFTSRHLGGTECGPSGEKEAQYLVVHGFVFRRQFPALVSGPEDDGQPQVTLLEPEEMQDFFKNLGVSTTKGWPLAQITHEAEVLWNAEQPRTKAYFATQQSFDPSAYLSLYRQAPLDGVLRKMKPMFFSTFEDDCAAAFTHGLSTKLSANMTGDALLAHGIRMKSISDINSLEMIQQYIITLERTLSKCIMLGPRWGVEATVKGRVNAWGIKVRGTKTVTALARLLLCLVDHTSPRVFKEEWFNCPTIKKTEASTVGKERYYKVDPSVSDRVLSRKRHWDRCQPGNMISLLARDRKGIVDCFANDSTPRGNKRKALKQRPQLASRKDSSSPWKLPGLAESNPWKVRLQSAEKSGEILASSDDHSKLSDDRSRVLRRRVTLGESAEESNFTCDLDVDNITEREIERKLLSEMCEIEDFSGHDMFWPLAGRGVFDPIGRLPRKEVIRLAKYAGTVRAAHVGYQDNFEVGQVSDFHVWRKRLLLCRSFEELLTLMRILASFLDATVISRATSISKNVHKVASSRASKVRSSHYDIINGEERYFVTENGNSGKWMTYREVGLDIFVAHHFLRRNKFLIAQRQLEQQRQERVRLKERQEREQKVRREAQQRAAREAQQRAAREAQRAAREAQQKAAREAQQRAAREAQQKAAREAQRQQEEKAKLELLRQQQEKARREAQLCRVSAVGVETKTKVTAMRSATAPSSWINENSSTSPEKQPSTNNSSVMQLNLIVGEHKKNFGALERRFGRGQIPQGEIQTLRLASCQKLESLFRSIGSSIDQSQLIDLLCEGEAIFQKESSNPTTSSLQSKKHAMPSSSQVNASSIQQMMMASSSASQQGNAQQKGATPSDDVSSELLAGNDLRGPAPKKRRRQRCGKCGGFGHNAKSCKKHQKDETLESSQALSSVPVAERETTKNVTKQNTESNRNAQDAEDFVRSVPGELLNGQNQNIGETNAVSGQETALSSFIAPTTQLSQIQKSPGSFPTDMIGSFTNEGRGSDTASTPNADSSMQMNPGQNMKDISGDNGLLEQNDFLAQVARLEQINQLQRQLQNEVKQKMQQQLVLEQQQEHQLKMQQEQQQQQLQQQQQQLQRQLQQRQQQQQQQLRQHHHQVSQQSTNQSLIEPTPLATSANFTNNSTGHHTNPAASSTSYPASGAQYNYAALPGQAVVNGNMFPPAPPTQWPYQGFSFPYASLGQTNMTNAGLAGCSYSQIGTETGNGFTYSSSHSHSTPNIGYGNLNANTVAMPSTGFLQQSPYSASVPVADYAYKSQRMHTDQVPNNYGNQRAPEFPANMNQGAQFNVGAATLNDNAFNQTYLQNSSGLVPGQGGWNNSSMQTQQTDASMSTLFSI